MNAVYKWNLFKRGIHDQDFCPYLKEKEEIFLFISSLFHTVPSHIKFALFFCLFVLFYFSRFLC